MLPGGVNIVGVYAFCPEASFKAAQPALQRVAALLPQTSTGAFLSPLKARSPQNLRSFLELSDVRRRPWIRRAPRPVCRCSCCG